MLDIAEMVMRNSKGCHGMSLSDAANHILNTQEAASLSVRSAYLYVAYHADQFPLNYFCDVAAFIYKNERQFPKSVIADVALQFIQQNKSFFISPITHHQQFSEFFISRKEKNSIEDYSRQL